MPCKQLTVLKNSTVKCNAIKERVMRKYVSNVGKKQKRELENLLLNRLIGNGIILILIAGSSSVRSSVDEVQVFFVTATSTADATTCTDNEKHDAD